MLITLCGRYYFLLVSGTDLASRHCTASLCSVDSPAEHRPLE